MWSLLTILVGGSYAAEVPQLSLKAPYFDHDYHNENWNHGGSSVIFKSGIDLTGDYPGQQGWINSRFGVLPDNFQLDVEFQLYGSARALFGDGMAVWFLEEPPHLVEGPVFGVQDKLKGTSLVFDTYRNHRPGKAFPYMVLGQNDGTIKYDIDNDGLANEIVGTSLRGLYNSQQKPSRLRVVYQKGYNFQVSLNYHNDKWETYVDQPMNLNGARWLAFSASTGQLSSVNRVTSIKVEEIPGHKPNDPQVRDSSANLHSQPGGSFGSHKSPSSSGWFGFLFKLVLFLAAVYAAPKLYRRYKRRGGSLLG